MKDPMKNWQVHELLPIIDRAALDLMDMPVTGGKKADGTLMTLAEISNQNSLIAMYNDGIRTLARVLAEQLSGEGENEETR